VLRKEPVMVAIVARKVVRWCGVEAVEGVGQPSAGESRELLGAVPGYGRTPHHVLGKVVLEAVSFLGRKLNDDWVHSPPSPSPG
jgi:hypothetical protein